MLPMDKLKPHRTRPKGVSASHNSGPQGSSTSLVVEFVSILVLQMATGVTRSAF